MANESDVTILRCDLPYAKNGALASSQMIGRDVTFQSPTDKVVAFDVAVDAIGR